MLKIGEVQVLKIKKIDSAGAHLECPGEEERVLLSADLVPLEKNQGDTIEVFVFTDRFGKAVVSLKKPSVQVGELGYLKVLDVSHKGAFLDWDFIVDIFAPNDNIFYNLIKGKSYLFRLFVNDERKIRATTDVYNYLRSDSHYSKNDRVTGTVYKKLVEGGYLIAIDNRYYGLIPVNECFWEIEYGEVVSGRIIRVKEDGKLDISPRQVAHIQLEDDAEYLLDLIKSRGGSLNLNDKTDPETIKKQLNMSKRAFKRAVGRLLREGEITQTKDSLQLIEK